MTLPNFADVQAAALRIAPHVHHTPVFTSQYLDERTRVAVFLKAENLQKVGAFKARGAMNAILSLPDDLALRGVVTHSSGNHGQAVAYACSVRGIRATIVMPEHAPEVKVEAVREYGATIEFCPQSERGRVVSELVDRRGLTEVHPFDDPMVIAGQATATLELANQVPDLDLVLTPIGGGGLLSGACLVAGELGFEAMGAEPEIVDDAHRSLRDGVRYGATGAVSVADGLLTGIGSIPFEILHGAGVSVVTVTEREIVEAMRTIAERTKLVVEPSGATAVAALIRYASTFEGRRVGIVLSGGNVSLETFSILSSRFTV